MKTTLQAALDHYGPGNQLAKLAEEASELSAAILQFLHPGDRDQDEAARNLLEEMDDVEICLQQARMIYNHIRPFRSYKLKRLASRLPAPSIYPMAQVLLPNGARKTVQDVVDTRVIAGDQSYNQDPLAEDFVPLTLYEATENERT